MHPYKVIFLESTFMKKKKIRKGFLDGLTTSRELEALLVDQQKQGFEFVSMVPVTGTTSITLGTVYNETLGFMVTFKKMEISED